MSFTFNDQRSTINVQCPAFLALVVCFVFPGCFLSWSSSLSLSMPCRGGSSCSLGCFARLRSFSNLRQMDRPTTHDKLICTN